MFICSDGIMTITVKISIGKIIEITKKRFFGLGKAYTEKHIDLDQNYLKLASIDTTWQQEIRNLLLSLSDKTDTIKSLINTLLVTLLGESNNLVCLLVKSMDVVQNINETQQNENQEYKATQFVWKTKEKNTQELAEPFEVRLINNKGNIVLQLNFPDNEDLLKKFPELYNYKEAEKKRSAIENSISALQQSIATLPQDPIEQYHYFGRKLDDHIKRFNAVDDLKKEIMQKIAELPLTQQDNICNHFFNNGFIKTHSLIELNNYLAKEVTKVKNENARLIEFYLTNQHNLKQAYQNSLQTQEAETNLREFVDSVNKSFTAIHASLADFIKKYRNFQTLIKENSSIQNNENIRNLAVHLKNKIKEINIPLLKIQALGDEDKNILWQKFTDEAKDEDIALVKFWLQNNNPSQVETKKEEKIPDWKNIASQFPDVQLHFDELIFSALSKKVARIRNAAIKVDAVREIFNAVNKAIANAKEINVETASNTELYNTKSALALAEKKLRNLANNKNVVKLVLSELVCLASMHSQLSESAKENFKKIEPIASTTLTADRNKNLPADLAKIDEYIAMLNSITKARAEIRKEVTYRKEIFWYKVKKVCSLWLYDRNYQASPKKVPVQFNATNIVDLLNANALQKGSGKQQSIGTQGGETKVKEKTDESILTCNNCWSFLSKLNPFKECLLSNNDDNSLKKIF